MVCVFSGPRSPLPILLLLLSGKLCWTLKMQWVPTSVLASPGDNVQLLCNYEKEKSENVDVTWLQIKWCQNISLTVNITESEANMAGRILYNQAVLEIKNTQKNDSALYQCKITLGNKIYKSCGTYLRVQEAESYAFFNIGETTKNKLITVEGVLLLLCTIIPGTLLLYKKRWENLSLLTMSQTGDNLYEGLNLEECSIYEDITRGLQATYEDVGSLRGTDIQLEKP